MSYKLEPIWEVGKDGRVKVLCVFQMLDKTILSRYLPIDKAKYHWVRRKDPVTGAVIGEDLFIDYGMIVLDNKEKYTAKGVPPLVYKEESPTEVRWQ